MISIIIPHLSLSNTDQILYECIKSFSQNIDYEWKIIYNDGGYAKAVNKGLSEATGEWLFVVNNDTKIIEGNIEWMLYPENITIPTIIPEPRDNNPRSFFCVPRRIYEEVKGFYANDFFDERFSENGGFYWEDDDLIARLELLGRDTLVISSVTVEHLNGGGLTAKQLGESYWYETNKKKFDEKWS